MYIVHNATCAREVAGSSTEPRHTVAKDSGQYSLKYRGDYSEARRIGMLSERLASEGGRRNVVCAFVANIRTSCVFMVRPFCDALR